MAFLLAFHRTHADLFMARSWITYNLASMASGQLDWRAEAAPIW